MSNALTFSRRAMLAATASMLVLPRTALAFSTSQASDLIIKVVDDINRIINSGQSERAMYTEFERLLIKYADMPRISVQVLGPPARQASQAQLNTFVKAFQGYISRKYGSRFREFIGGRIQVDSTKQIKSIYEVRCTAILAGEPPFAISFIVADQTGRFIDLTIEGISLLKSERAEVGAMLDASGGSIDGLIDRLNAA